MFHCLKKRQNIDPDQQKVEIWKSVLKDMPDASIDVSELAKDLNSLTSAFWRFELVKLILPYVSDSINPDAVIDCMELFGDYFKVRFLEFVIPKIGELSSTDFFNMMKLTFEHESVRIDVARMVLPCLAHLEQYHYFDLMKIVSQLQCFLEIFHKAVNSKLANFSHRRLVSVMKLIELDHDKHTIACDLMRFIDSLNAEQLVECLKTFKMDMNKDKFLIFVQPKCNIERSQLGQIDALFQLGYSKYSASLVKSTSAHLHVQEESALERTSASWC